MAKAKAICTCATCGKNFEKTADRYNRKECFEWEAWAVENCVECPSCWGKRMREIEKNTPVYAFMIDSAFSSENFGEIEYHFILRGNTYPFKEQAKQMGFRWTEEPPTRIESILAIERPKMAWVYTCKRDGIKDIVKKIYDAGLELKSGNTPFLDLWNRYCESRASKQEEGGEG